MRELGYEKVQSAVKRSALSRIEPYIFQLMLRNMASNGFTFVDPISFDEGQRDKPPQFSEPGCIIASPSFPKNLAAINQIYVYNWVRDAAIVATEIALAKLPAGPGSDPGPLNDYVSFAKLCQDNSDGDYSWAAYTIVGRPRTNWSHQNDGPALQALALLQIYDQLDQASRPAAIQLLWNDVQFVLDNYQKTNKNLWEEVRGASFFIRSVQLRCLREIKANVIGLQVPRGIDQAIADLQRQLEDHWDDKARRYVSILNPSDYDANLNIKEYDPNVDIVSASVYGAIECTSPRLLATAAQVREQWTDPNSTRVFPINLDDAKLGWGPLMGRYPGDTYDGNTDPGDPEGARGHPWPLCTANFAELYYNVAAAIKRDESVPHNELSADFFEQVGVDGNASVPDAATKLGDAGDRMLEAIVYHSDHFELSEQFDATTGYEKSVRNLTWSYAAFVSAVRARKRIQP